MIILRQKNYIHVEELQTKEKLSRFPIQQYLKDRRSIAGKAGRELKRINRAYNRPKSEFLSWIIPGYNETSGNKELKIQRIDALKKWVGSEKEQALNDAKERQFWLKKR